MIYDTDGGSEHVAPLWRETSFKRSNLTTGTHVAKCFEKIKLPVLLTPAENILMYHLIKIPWYYTLKSIIVIKSVLFFLS